MVAPQTSRLSGRGGIASTGPKRIGAALSWAALLGAGLCGTALAADKNGAFIDAAPPTPAVAAPSVPAPPSSAPSSSTPSPSVDTESKRGRAVDDKGAKYADALRKLAVLAAGGDPSAQLELGRSHRAGTHAEHDPETAMRWLSAAARANLPAAHYQLGLLHMSGAGDRPSDLVEAYARFKIASGAGDVRATALIFYIGVRMTADELRDAQERITEIRRYEIDPTSRTPPAARTVAEEPEAAPK